MIVRRLVWTAVALGAAAFAVQGGEYATTDLVRQRERRRAALADLDTLGRQVDSLRALKERLAADPALQERVAREEYGMVRGDKELLYWISDPAGDSARANTPSLRR